MKILLSRQHPASASAVLDSILGVLYIDSTYCSKQAKAYTAGILLWFLPTTSARLNASKLGIWNSCSDDCLKDNFLISQTPSQQ